MTAARRKRGDREPHALDALAAKLRDRRAILFVGSGASAALGLPAWRGLVERLGVDLGMEADELEELGADFRSVAEFYRLEKGSLDALHDWMTHEWRVPDEALERSAVHRLIVELDFPVIYTTNYDSLLERAFELRGRKFNKTVTAQDIAAEDPALPTIVKFHGDLSDDRSLVVTETDYFRRLAFDEPLDIKLTADVLGRTVLFIGYSLTDVNLRLMLYRMRGIWLDAGFETIQPRSYIFMARPNAVQERILDSWGIAPIAGDAGDESAALVAFLERLAAAVGKRRA